MIRSDLPFGARTAQRLMAIARDDRLAKATHVSLPASWGTLYELSRLDDATLAIALKSGSINPEMKPKDVAAIAGKPPKAKAVAEDPDRRARRPGACRGRSG